MKKLLLPVLCLLLLFACTGQKKSTDSTDNTSKKFEIAVCLPGSVEFFDVEKRGMNEAAEKYGLTLIYSDAEWDANKQLNQVENFVTKGVDMVLLCASDNVALLPAVDLCNEAGIPLITFTNVIGDNPTGEYDGVISFIGINDVTSGRYIGKMAEKLLGDKDADIVLLEGSPGTSAQRMRTKGFMEIVDQHSNWNIVYSQAIEGWSKETALSAMEAFLQTGKNVDIVSCHWHAAASAAAQAIKEADVDKKIYVTGLEFTKEIVQFIKDGKVDMTTNASISGMGFTAVETAYKYLNGESVPSVIEIEPEIVDITNVDSITPEM